MGNNFITKDKNPLEYDWLRDTFDVVSDIYNISFNHNHSHLFTLDNGKINTKCSIALYAKIKKIKHPFGYVKGSFYCINSSLITLENIPIKIMGDFNCSHSDGLKSIKGCSKIINGDFDFSHCNNIESFENFPKYVKGKIRFPCGKFSNNPNERRKYTLYIDMWLELFESVSDKERDEYVKSYINKIDSFYGVSILPKEVINYYKITNLLKE